MLFGTEQRLLLGGGIDRSNDRLATLDVKRR
jgi:hypothetical protein